MGKCKYIYSTGDYYEGDWVDGESYYLITQFLVIFYFRIIFLGKAHGKGGKHMKMGDSYVGDWLFGKAHGIGIYKHSNGNKVSFSWI